MPTDSEFRVVAYDYRRQTDDSAPARERGCNVTVVPATATADEVLALDPDGVFLSNGPGDPEPCDLCHSRHPELVENGTSHVRHLPRSPTARLASGAATVKMPYGHHGANHPVKDLATDAS